MRSAVAPRQLHTGFDFSDFVPAFLDDQAIADAVKEHRVVASFGPFVEMEINGAVIGSDVASDGEEIEIAVRVQAPSWMGVDRVELYENGTLIHEWELEDTGEVLRLDDALPAFECVV